MKRSSGWAGILAASELGVDLRHCLFEWEVNVSGLPVVCVKNRLHWFSEWFTLGLALMSVQNLDEFLLLNSHFSCKKPGNTKNQIWHFNSIIYILSFALQLSVHCFLLYFCFHYPLLIQVNWYLLRQYLILIIRLSSVYELQGDNCLYVAFYNNLIACSYFANYGSLQPDSQKSAFVSLKFHLF